MILAIRRYFFNPSLGFSAYEMFIHKEAIVKV